MAQANFFSDSFTSPSPLDITLYTMKKQRIIICKHQTD